MNVVEGVIKSMSYGNEGTEKAYCRIRILDSATHKIEHAIVLGKDEVSNLRERDIQTEESVVIKGRLIGKIYAESIERDVPEE